MFLQETHIFHEIHVKLYSKDYPTWYYGNSTTRRAWGVAIGLARGVRFSLEERMVDPEGRYLFLKGRLCEMYCTLANIYCPNKNPTNYLKEVMGKLMDFKKGSVITTGDLNFCIDPRIDSTSRVQGIRNPQLKTIKREAISISNVGCVESTSS